MQNEADLEAAAGRPPRVRHDGEGLERTLGPARPVGGASAAAPGAMPGAFEDAFRASPVALAVTRDPHCGVVVRNAAMNRIVPASLDWRAWRMPDGSAPALFEGGVPLPLERQPLRLAAFRGEASNGREIEVRWPDREPVFCRVSAAPLLDDHGAACGAVVSAVDIGAEKQAERARALQRIHDAASRRAKDELLGLAGHELRNPLHAIATAVEVLDRAAPTAPEALSARRIIGRQTRRLAELIGEIGETGRALAMTAEPFHRPLDLGALLADRVGRATPAAEARAQGFEPELVAIDIDGDAPRLAGALDRLLDHALQTASPGSAIAVQLVRSTGPGGNVEAVLRVGDAEALDGDGGADWALARPADGDVAVGRIGLSLVQVRHVVEQHGGRIDATRNGNVFVLRLPVGGAELDPAVPGDLS